MKIVIMAGGRGTRFWPASRSAFPKQFLAITTRRSMLQETVQRLLPRLSASDIYVVCGPDYVDTVREQLPEFSQEQILVEPLARSTAACVGLAARYLKDRHGDAVCAFLPADHAITRVERFHAALQVAERLAHQEWLVTFGIVPDRAATGYGYIERGEFLEKTGGLSAFRVGRFVEKPDLEVAQGYLESGRHFWNSGMFVWQASTILKEIDRSLPRLSTALNTIASDWEDVESARRAFRELDPISIDYGVLERSSRVATVPCDFGWSDVGDWRSVREQLARDPDGNASNTPIAVLDARDCLAYSREGKLIALIGVENLVVVETPDALLICSGDRTQDVKSLVATLDPEYT